VGKWTSFHLFCGGGGDALGFQRADFNVLGGLDDDPLACADFAYLTGAPAHCEDVTELVPRDLRNMTKGVRPDVVITSPPCKGNSSCLPEAQAETEHYQKLNSLSQLGVWLVLEAWEAPPPLILLENVDRITSRSREWLDQTIAMLRAYDYAVTESKHDCGVLGGLAQHRKRYMLVARHQPQVSALLFEPPPKRVKGIGEVIGSLPVPVPGQDSGGEMHHLPRLSPMNWLRLACIPAGGDYRDLPEAVKVCDGYRGRYGIVDWLDPSKTVRANHEARLAPASTADPRVNCAPRATAYGVADWQAAAKTVLAHGCHDNGEFSIADPRVTCRRREGSIGVKRWDEASTPIIANATIHNHPCSLADPRLTYDPRGDSYGVASMDEPSKVIRAVQKHQNGVSSVADDRAEATAVPTHVLLDGDEFVLVGPELDLDSYQSADPVPVILSPDGTWHRPMTTLELALIQGFPVKRAGAWLKFSGNSHAAWRERIGNAIPPPTAEAIAKSCIDTLEAAAEGRWMLSNRTVWVEPETVAQR
jgi:site-specific DNA-cytosine methylase